jgi:hypothetical protein
LFWALTIELLSWVTFDSSDLSVDSADATFDSPAPAEGADFAS